MGKDREEIFKKRREQRRERKENNKQAAPYRYLIVCEGKKTEPFYFKGIKRKLEEKFNNKIRIVHKLEIDIEGTGRNTNDLVNYVGTIVNKAPLPYGHIWVVFDKDDFTDDQFNSSIEQANSQGYKVGWSNEAIELWFLLHFEYLNTAIDRHQYIDKLSVYFKKFGINDGKYEKNLRNIYNILIEYGDVKIAIDNSKKLLKMHEEHCSTSSKADMKPATMVFKLVSELSEYL